MMRPDRLTVVLHDDTEIQLPPGSSYHLSRAGVEITGPDGKQASYDAWDVLRVETSTKHPARKDRP